VSAVRQIVTLLSLLGVLALAGPAVSFATGGGSAGDQQYVDPFGHTHKSTTTSTTTNAPPPTTTAPATTTPAAPAATTTPAAASSDSNTATDPTATIASSTTTTGSLAKTLPYTGYDSWLAGGLGLVLAGAGLTLRRKAQRG
jgi:LPXTG-motif cell wall-anchored protein